MQNYNYITILILNIVIVYLLYCIKCIKKSHADRIAKMSERQGNSVELSDFLNDINHRGFSFVRIEPSSIIMRSPRS